MGIVAGKFYNCEWMVGDIYEAALNVGQKSLEARQDEKEPNVFVQWLNKRLPRAREKATEIPS